MNLCIHRATQKGPAGSYSFCLDDKSRCSGLRQAGCTVAEFWPLYLIAALVLCAVVMNIVV